MNLYYLWIVLKLEMWTYKRSTIWGGTHRFKTLIGYRHQMCSACTCCGARRRLLVFLNLSYRGFVYESSRECNWGLRCGDLFLGGGVGSPQDIDGGNPIGWKRCDFPMKCVGSSSSCCCWQKAWDFCLLLSVNH